MIKKTVSDKNPKTRKVIRSSSEQPNKNICINKECKLRINGCRGFEGCPGYKTL